MSDHDRLMSYAFCTCTCKCATVANWRGNERRWCGCCPEPCASCSH